jgi:hypothetical protein
MKRISINEISVDEQSQQISIKDERFHLDDIITKYSESRLFSYLEIKAKDNWYLIKGLKSIWEQLNLSTYDSYEKSEDNKVYDLYWTLNYLKRNRQKESE